ncbi:DUF6528 family protein [Allokutzneria albata]|uniref:PQQ-like domain-containing protein n=1 Tax=Allokutzneria albata TaxID=211114 RepID=A0A1G9YCF2_ALLAB|nr:DUF6528 family protein [Allokutzneria albata]SDN06778.1 hypothetical protein SAMN04489726_4740 [Allokutzneria albata]
MLIRFTGVVLGAVLGTTALAAPAVADPALAASVDVVTAEQASKKIMIFDPAVASWNGSGATKWAWSPTSANGFSAQADGASAEASTSAAGWSNPSDMRLRSNSHHGGQVLVTAASGGFLGVASFPAGKRKWSVAVPGADNPHAAELLPNGNVAAAASHGGWIRLYAASQGPNATKHAQYDLPGGHGVLWDPQGSVLWAIGDNHLVALKVGGTAANPTLSEARKVALPSKGGHDLQPVYGNKDRLWITTSSQVYQFSKSTGAFSTDYAHAASANRTSVKSIGNHPQTGQLIEAKPKAGCRTTWCTDTIDFFGADAKRTRTGAEFYKARFWYAAYQ